MDIALAAVCAVVAAIVVWVAVGRQHLLYTEPEFRAAPIAGPKLFRYRVIASVVAAACAAVILRPGHYDLGPGLLTVVFVVGFIVLATTDFERRRLPNRLSYPMMLLALALCWAWPDRSIADIAIGTGVAIGFGIVLFVFGLLVAGLAGGGTGFGLGDVKLILLIGLLVGWPAAMSAWLFGIIAAGVPGLALTLAGRGKRTFAYGPFLVLGALVVLLWPGPFVG